MESGLLVPTTIVCVDCGGTCHLVGQPDPEEGWRAGDVAVYRCAECADRWDVVIEDPADDAPITSDPLIDGPAPE